MERDRERALARRRRVAARTVALLAGLLVGAVCVEIAARLWLGPPATARTLFFSPPPWRVWPDGTIRYPPRARVRSVALYGGRVAYDVTFETNDAGLVDRRDYLVPSREGVRERIALVGDSFTAGFHGGEPWVPALAGRLRIVRPDVALYDLGVGATGIVQFADLALALDATLHFDRVVLLPIGQDFRRPEFRPLVDGDHIHLCRAERDDRACLAVPSRILAMRSMAEPVADLRERARDEPQAPRPLWARTRLGEAVLALATRTAQDLPSEPLPEATRDALARLAARFPGPRLVVLRLPEKEEVRTGRLHQDVSADLTRLGIESRSLLGRCGLEVSDFHREDPHPNARGYARISDCVARELGLP